MLHRGIKFAYAALLVASSAMAFTAMRIVDETDVVGSSYVVSFGRTENGASGPRVAEMLDAFVRAHGVNVGRLYQDPRDDSSRRIHLAVGDPDAQSTHWLTHGYPAFSRDSRIELRPYREIVDIYPDGHYYVYGPQQAATALAREFAPLGYHGGVESTALPGRLVELFGHGVLLWCLLILGFVVVLAVASAVTLDAKSYGIQRLQGQSFARILSRDLVHVAGFCAVAASGVAAVTAGLLYLYNGLHQAATFALVALSLAGLHAGAALLTHVVTLALVHRDAILNAVKGEVTAGWAVAGSYLLRITAVSLVFTVGTSAMVSGLALQEQSRRSQIWAELGDAYYLRLGGAVQDEQNGRAIDAGIGRWIRDADTRGEVALAWRHRAGSRLAGRSGRDVLVVNDTYLTRHEIYDAAGARVGPSGERTIRVLVPHRYARESTGLVTRLTDWAKFQAGRANTEVLPPVRPEAIRDDQSVPAYARAFGMGDLLLDAPVLVVVTGASGVIPDDEYTSLASRGELLFEDPERVMTGLAGAGVDSYVLGLSPFAQEAADRYREVRREFSLQLVNLVSTMAILLITALALAIVYCRRNAQALFVKYLCGWGFLRTHRWILAAEGTLTLVLMAWTWHTTKTLIDGYRLPGAPPAPAGLLDLRGWEPVLAGGVGLSSLALFVLVLLRTNTTLAKTHSASLS